MQTHIKAFVAGFLSTLIFHQGVLALLYAIGATARAPWNVEGVPPFGIPAVVSLAFFGGLWGIVLWLLIRNTAAAGYWLRAVVYGALGPSLVAWFVVMPLKGMAPAGNFEPSIIVGALLLNGAWGLGVALLMRAFLRLGARPA